MDIWSLFFAAIGVAMFLEGTPYFVSPASMRRFLKVVESMSDPALRLSGLGLMAAGLVVAFLATR